MTQTIAADDAARARPLPSVAEIERRRPALPSLTGARWWAAFAVFVLHAMVFLPVYPFQWSALFRRIDWFVPMQLGACGVTFFFVLSGFIIYWSYKPGTDVVGFYRRRVLKIYPSHLVAMAAFIIATGGIPWSHLHVWLPNLFLVHTWVPTWTLVGGLNVPSWSLGAEMLFYLTFPLFLPLLRRIPSHNLWLAAALIFVLIVALHTSYYLWVDGPKGITNEFAPRLRAPHDVSPHFEPHADPRWFTLDTMQPPRSYWLSYTFPLTRLPEFLLGVLAARMVLERQWRNTRIWPPLLALALSFAATWFVPVNYKMGVLLLLPTTAVIATMAARDLAGIRGLNASPRMIWLGNVSFAFYLVQYPIMVAVTRFLIGGHSYGFWGWLGFATLCLVLSVGGGALVYYWVDLPIMRNFARSKPKPAADAPPVARAA
ncbi:acyltransferase family protein [Nocardia stercoris]|uniref:Acyltransferase n=1 Tax=Nocardia stercoris TaxID=2483361 RepID=A0A3M2L1L3_9NOCA|nr:acyltransferase [Nocardia stercoris]RMI28438.1 acyltransferase [Nocardia stercoris]